MSQRQKEQQAADGQPPAGPNGELQFQPQAEGKGEPSELEPSSTVVMFVSIK